MSIEDDKNAIEEVQRILGGGESENQCFSFTISFEAAMDIGVTLDFPRKKSGIDTEDLNRVFKDLDHRLIGDPILRRSLSLDDPDSLLDPQIQKGKQEDRVAIPYEETLLYMLADKFPTLQQLEECAKEPYQKLRPPHYLSLNYKEVDTLGHLVLKSLAKATEEVPPQNTFAKKINARLVYAFSSVYAGFVGTGGKDNITLKEAFQKFT